MMVSALFQCLACGAQTEDEGLCVRCWDAQVEINREALADYQRRYRLANREALADYQRRYREANREALAEKRRRYYQENRTKKEKASVVSAGGKEQR